MIRKTLSLLLCFLAFGMVKAQTNLPVVNIMGRDFYCYTVADNDKTPYSICQINSWDIDTLGYYNSDALSRLSKEMRLFYPVSTVETVPSLPDLDSGFTLQDTVNHVVKKGESVYSIARVYGIEPDDIYAFNPSSRHGLKAGETIRIPNKGDKILYMVKRGDTLFALAREYNTTVEDILKSNAGLTPDKLRADTVIRIPAGSASKNLTEVQVPKQRVASFRIYKATGKDTWNSIARENEIDLQTLREANPGVELKKNAYIAIPRTEEYVATEIQIAQDPREETREGRSEIYREVREGRDANAQASQQITAQPEEPEAKEVVIAIVLEKPGDKLCQEFMLGFLQALDQHKNSDTRIDLRIIDAATMGEPDDNEKLTTADVVLAVYEKDFPGKLARFGQKNHIEIINVFDVKSEYYLDNPAVANLLAPAEYFNDAVLEKVTALFKDHKLIVVGNLEADDVISKSILETLGSNHTKLTVEQFEEFTFPEEGKYLVFFLPTDKASVSKALTKTAEAREGAGINCTIDFLGRPNLVVYAESMNDKLGAAGAYIPARVFLNPGDISVKNFMSGFKELYGREPANTFPVYAAMGYDTANWIIPTVAYNQGDFNIDYPGSVNFLQTVIKIKRLTNWSGFINPVAYMLHFTPYYVEKVKIE